MIYKARANCSGSVARPIISAFQAEDSGSNPGRSILPQFFYVTSYVISHVISLSQACEHSLRVRGLGPLARIIGIFPVRRR